jgi:acyl-coenzyme A thioesterase PaaI-like protein
MALSIVKTWQYWSVFPLIGRWIFAILTSFVSPYTGTIPMRYVSIEQGKAVSLMYDSWYVRNPFKSVHAAALTNFGEATMGMAILYWCEENNAKSIPSRLDVSFMKKARGTLKGVCSLPEDLESYCDSGKEVQLKTDIFDQKGDLVCQVNGYWKVSALKKKLD